MRPPTSNPSLEAVSRLGRDVSKGNQLDQLLESAARHAADATGADSALVIERTLGNRLNTVSGSFGWEPAPDIRDLGTAARARPGRS